MLQFIIKFIKKIFLKKLKIDFSRENFSDFKFISLWYTFRFICLLFIPIMFYDILRKKILDYSPRPAYYNDIPGVISVFFNKSYDEITWDEINEAKEYLKNRNSKQIQIIEVQEEYVKPDRLIRLEFILKIVHLYLLLLLSIIIIVILSRDLVKNKIIGITDYIYLKLLNNIKILILDKKKRNWALLIIFIFITFKIICYII